MATSPTFTSVVNTSVAQLSVANTNSDGTGTLVDLFTAGANGSRLDDIWVKAVGSTTAGRINLFIYDGTNNRYFTSIAVNAVTMSATLDSFEDGKKLNIILKSGQKLRGAPYKGETFNVFCFGGDF